MTDEQTTAPEDDQPAELDESEITPEGEELEDEEPDHDVPAEDVEAHEAIEYQRAVDVANAETVRIEPAEDDG